MAREWYNRPVNSGYDYVDGVTTGNYNNGVPNTYVKTWMEYKVLQDDTDRANNRSRIDVKLYSQVIDGGSASGMSSATTANNYGYVGYDNANQQYLSTTYNFNNFALNKFADATLTIPHNTDGTKSITLQGAFQTLSGTWAITGGSVSTSVSLPTIPKGTEITTVAGLHYGVPTSFYMSRKSSNFRERVTMTNGGTTLTIKTTDTADANFTYKLDRDYTPNTAYPSSSTWTVAVYTYNGATLVETKTYSYTWTIADWDLDAYYPYASYGVQAYNDAVSALGTDTAVAGYSKINVVASLSNAHGVHNATIASRVVQFQDGRTVSGANDTNHISNLINTAGSYSFTYTITDSRGLSKQYSGSYTVINSSAPTLNTFTCYRGDSSGNISDSGTYIWILTVGSCDSLNGHNSFVTSARIDSGSPATLTDSQWTYLTSSASPQSTYVVTVTIADLLRSTSYTKTIQSEDIPLVIREGGKGVGIGAYCKGEGLLNIGYEVDEALKGKGGRYIATCNIIDESKIEQGGIGSGGDLYWSTLYVRSDWTEVKGSTTYTMQYASNVANVHIDYMWEYDANKALVAFRQYSSTFTTNVNTRYMRFRWTKDEVAAIVPSEVYNVQLEGGNSASNYLPYTMDADKIKNEFKEINTMMQWVRGTYATAKVVNQPNTYFSLKLFGYVGGIGGISLTIGYSTGNPLYVRDDAMNPWSNSWLVIGYNEGTHELSFSAPANMVLVLIGC